MPKKEESLYLLMLSHVSQMIMPVLRITIWVTKIVTGALGVCSDLSLQKEQIVLHSIKKKKAKTLL